ncbi:Acg family FMN-binding oxidoreductase [Actinomadura keratinilytica]|uniref:Nitroreductase family protein n=1 Tax=Actinomadura keratinilytica TaxID=547461 RepID=A0ABP7Z4N8_9ACTN
MEPTRPRVRNVSETPAEDVRRAVEAAVWAPSVHNTQPWIFSHRGSRITLRADPDRRLGVADPTGREMVISCGAALLTLRVAIRRLGYRPEVRLLPDPDRPNLLADVILGARIPPDGDDRRLYDQIRRRRTHRGGFAPGDGVSPALRAKLRLEAQREGAGLPAVEDPHALHSLAALTEAAEHLQQLDAPYLHESARWAPRPGSPRPEGVHEESYPRRERRTDPYFPGRDFSRGQGWGAPPEPAREEVTGLVLLITTSGDAPDDWLRAGQALQRVLLRAAQDDVSAAFHTQALEIPELRELVRRRFCGGRHPQMLLRLGRAGAARPGVRRPAEQSMVEDF